MVVYVGKYTCNKENPGSISNTTEIVLKTYYDIVTILQTTHLI